MITVCIFNEDVLKLNYVLHFLNEGVGLRQICDWTCMLHTHGKQLDKDRLAAVLKGIGMLKAARAFGVIATKFLGLPIEDLPFELNRKDEELGEWLLQDVLEGGNYGWYF